MKLLITLIATLILGALLGRLLPFWSLSLAAFFVGAVLRPGGWRGFAAGALAGLLLWGGLALWADHANAGILSARIGALFGTSGTGLVLITAVLGALLAGLGCALGDRVRKAIT
jgi:hypothetical protein